MMTPGKNPNFLKKNHYPPKKNIMDSKVPTGKGYRRYVSFQEGNWEVATQIFFLSSHRKLGKMKPF